MLTQTAADLDLDLFTPLPDAVDGEWIIKSDGGIGIPDAYTAHGIVNEARYIRPLHMPDLPGKYLCYDRAEELADTIEFHPGSRHFAVLSGNFIFGDFIEALLVRKQWQVKTMTISSLSMSENNIDSLANLIEGEFLLELNVIVSDYFFSHERFGLVPYIYERLDTQNRFQLSVANTHCKLCYFETVCGKKIVMHGSANLRSSGSIEQVMIEWNDELYDFNESFNRVLIDRYKTINKLPLTQISATVSEGKPAPLAAIKELKRDSKPKAWRQAAAATHA